MKFHSATLIRLAIIAISGLAWLSCSREEAGGKAVIPESDLFRLDATIKMAGRYQSIKESRLDSLRDILAGESNPKDRWGLEIELAEQYRQMNADSAIYYANMATTDMPSGISRSDSLRAGLSMVNALGTAGLFIPAVRGLDSIADILTAADDKIEFWKSSRMLYSYMLAYVQDHGRIASDYRQRYIACDDSLLTHIPKEDPFYRFIFCERLVNDGRNAEAKSGLEALMKSLPPESNIYGMAAFQLAEVYKSNGDFRNYARSLATSAESDIKGCVKEGLALPTLANWLFTHGHIDNAFNYINFALEDANAGNIRMRTVTITALMPLIDEAYRKKLNDSNENLMMFLLAAVLLLAISGGLVFKLIRSNKRSTANERKLAIFSKKLEAYVGNFISLCSNYATRLDQLGKIVGRKISSGQADDLLKLVNSGKLYEGNNDDFYRLIDKALLDIFPDFVENINTLLLPEHQILRGKEEPLSPELRIYAFVRLGVDQSPKIAQILNYSVNTVYAYRNRMRNRAIDRDNFDSDVANLGMG